MLTYQWTLISSMTVVVSLKRWFESNRQYNCGYRIMVITPHFQCGDECSIHSTRTKRRTVRRLKWMSNSTRLYLGLMPTAGRLICNQIVWVRFPQCPPNKQLKEWMMREVLSGTSESSKVKLIRVNTNTDWLRKLKKTLKRVKYKLRVGSGSHKKK